MQIINHNAQSLVPNNAKWTFSTRRVNPNDIKGLSTAFADAIAGDLMLGQVSKIGQHKKLQLSSGRYSETFLDDHVVLCVGDRYAPDQFEGIAEINPFGCDLLAGGGIAGKVVQAHSKMSSPTQITPIGLLSNHEGDVINIVSYALPISKIPASMTVIGVFGTSMNAGKTTTAASLAHGLLRAGYQVAGIKATGTGAFGDFNTFQDAGISMSDFTDAGMATTYKMTIERIEDGFETLVGNAAAGGAEIAIVEFADGVLQGETHQILKDSRIRERLDGIVFASGDAAGAVGSVMTLRAMGYEPLAVSGLISCSPLASQEAEAVVDLPILTCAELHTPEIVERIIEPVMRQSNSLEEAA